MVQDYYTAPPSIEAAVLAEREACAQIVEGDPDYDWHKFCCEAVAKIRARGEK